MLYNTKRVDHNHAPLNLSDLDLSWNRLNFRHVNSQLTKSPVCDCQRCEDKDFFLRLKLVLFVGPHSHLRVLVTKEPQRDHYVELLVGHLSHLGQHYRCNCDLWTFWNTRGSLIGRLAHAKFEIDHWVMLQIVDRHSVKILSFDLRDLSKSVDLIFPRIATYQRPFIFYTIIEFHSHN